VRNLAVDPAAAGIPRDMRHELTGWMRAHGDGLIQHFHMMVDPAER